MTIYTYLTSVLQLIVVSITAAVSDTPLHTFFPCRLSTYTKRIIVNLCSFLYHDIFGSQSSIADEYDEKLC